MYHLVILYEDLVEDPEREARKVFKLLGLSTEYMHTALEALKEDSQKGTFGPRGVTAHISDESFAKVVRLRISSFILQTSPLTLLGGMSFARF